MESSRRLDCPTLTLSLVPAFTVLVHLSTCCRTAWRCQLVTLQSSHLPGVLNWDSISQACGLRIAKVQPGQPRGCCGPGVSRRREQQLGLAEHNRVCDGRSGFGFHFFLVQFTQTYGSGGVSPQHTSYPLPKSSNVSWWHTALKAVVLTVVWLEMMRMLMWGFTPSLRGRLRNKGFMAS